MTATAPGQAFDVLVLGGGMAGASLAAQLGGQRRVAILEREPLLCAHTTGRSAAMFLPSYGVRQIHPLTRASRAFFDAPPRGFDTPLLTPRAALHIARAADVGELAELAAELDYAPMLTRAQARAIVPVLRPGAVAAGLLESDAGDLDVARLHAGFIRACREAGGVVLTGLGETTIRRAGSLWRVATALGEFAAPVLVDAAGAWADATAEAAGLTPKGLRPLRRTVVLADAPGIAGFADWPTVKDVGERFYFRPFSSDLLITPCDETPSAPCDACAEEFDVATAVTRFEAATRLRVRRVAHRWAGLRTFAPDRAPVIGWSEEAEGFFWMAGLGGFGIQTAPASGRLAASLILHGRAPAALIDQGVEPADYAPGRLRAPLAAAGGAAAGLTARSAPCGA
jgi:D-arginine dehydrogenase